MSDIEANAPMSLEGVPWRTSRVWKSEERIYHNTLTVANLQIDRLMDLTLTNVLAQNALEIIEFEMGLRYRNSLAFRYRMERPEDNDPINTRYDSFITTLCEEIVKSGPFDADVPELMNWIFSESKNREFQVKLAEKVAQDWPTKWLHHVFQSTWVVKQKRYFLSSLLDQIPRLMQTEEGGGLLWLDIFIFCLHGIQGSHQKLANTLNSIVDVCSTTKSAIAMETLLSYFETEPMVSRSLNNWLSQHAPEHLKFIDDVVQHQPLEEYYSNIHNQTKLFDMAVCLPTLSAEYVLKRLFAAKLLNLSDIFILIDYDYLEEKDGLNPLAKSLFWVHKTVEDLIERLNEEKDRCIWYYENELSVATKNGIWCINLDPERWLYDKPEPTLKFQPKESSSVESVCIHLAELPIGDKYVTMLLACWNDTLVAEDIYPMSEVMEGI